MNRNKVELAGRLTRDPEIRYTPKGKAVCDIGIAVNEYSNKDGERVEEVAFIDVTFWGRTAEIIGENFSKGMRIHLDGKLKLDTWEDKATGQKRNKLKVVGWTFQFIDKRDPDKQTDPKQPASAGAEDGDDIPF